ncbi:radical SAM protein [Patescibacteria group bacterium]|nr:radical SAM protein [Patescibacteria group bacterium]MBU4482271.1 radical SAM protein [Patescibacteria group bacterium]
MDKHQKINLLKLAIKYPQITKSKIGHWLNKKLKKTNDFPSLVRFFLFYGCNLRCKMCGQWGQKGTSKSDQIKNFLNIKKLKQLIDECEKYKPEIYIWGGEPTLHPDFAEFIKYVKLKKLTATINTNGILLEKYADDILNNKIDSLDVSLIGPPAIHDTVVQVPGAFEKVMAGLELISDKSKRYKYKPLIKAIITLNPDNLGDVEKLLYLIENHLAIDMSIVQLGWFTIQEIGKRYEKRMQTEFKISSLSWQGFQDEQASKQAEKIQQLIKDIRCNKKYKKPILIFPNLKTKDIAKYYQNHQELFNYKKCSAVNREIDIRHNGDVVVCADYPDYVIGNLNTQSIQEIWRGEKLKKFRKSIQKKLLPICPRCCGLFR